MFESEGGGEEETKLFDVTQQLHLQALCRSQDFAAMFKRSFVHKQNGSMTSLNQSPVFKDRILHLSDSEIKSKN